LPRHCSIWAARSRRILLVQRQHELKRRAALLIAEYRQASRMRLHDRAADRESHAHAAGFGGEERHEDVLAICFRNPGAGIGDSKANPAEIILTGADREPARAVAN